MIIQLVFQAQTCKERLSENKLKAKSPDVYHDRFHIECYKFDQQCKDYFATVEATKLNQILFWPFFVKIKLIFTGNNTKKI